MAAEFYAERNAPRAKNLILCKWKTLTIWRVVKSPLRRLGVKDVWESAAGAERGLGDLHPPNQILRTVISLPGLPRVLASLSASTSWRGRLCCHCLLCSLSPELSIKRPRPNNTQRPVEIHQVNRVPSGCPPFKLM